MVKRCVFNAFLKMAIESDCLTWTGRAFHSWGPVLAKLQSPQAVRVLGTASCRPSELELCTLNIKFKIRGYNLHKLHTHTFSKGSHSNVKLLFEVIFMFLTKQSNNWSIKQSQLGHESDFTAATQKESPQIRQMPPQT